MVIQHSNIKRFSFVFLFLLSLPVSEVKPHLIISERTLYAGTAVCGAIGGMGAYLISKNRNDATPENKKMGVLKRTGIIAVATVGAAGISYYILSKYTPRGWLDSIIKRFAIFEKNPLTQVPFTSFDEFKSYIKKLFVKDTQTSIIHGVSMISSGQTPLIDAKIVGIFGCIEAEDQEAILKKIINISTNQDIKNVAQEKLSSVQKMHSLLQKASDFVFSSQDHAEELKNVAKGPTIIMSFRDKI